MYSRIKLNNATNKFAFQCFEVRTSILKYILHSRMKRMSFLMFLHRFIYSWFLLLFVSPIFSLKLQGAYAPTKNIKSATDKEIEMIAGKWFTDSRDRQGERKSRKKANPSWPSKSGTQSLPHDMSCFSIRGPTRVNSSWKSSLSIRTKLRKPSWSSVANSAISFS